MTRDEMKRKLIVRRIADVILNQTTDYVGKPLTQELTEDMVRNVREFLYKLRVSALPPLPTEPLKCPIPSPNGRLPENT